MPHFIGMRKVVHEIRKAISLRPPELAEAQVRKRAIGFPAS